MTAKPKGPVQTAIRWASKKLFSGPFNTIISILLLALISTIGYQLFRWAIWDATWTGLTKEACAANDGACWIFIREKFRFFMFGFYPIEWIWRPILVLFSIPVVLYLLFRQGGKHFIKVFICSLVTFPLIVYVILQGFGDFFVSPDKWGGLTLTLVLSFLGLFFSFPFGIILALLRTGKLRILRVCAITFIEFFRGIPLITILFMAAIVFPLFLPSEITVSKIFRLVMGLTIFQSVYLAEVIRGGLQSVEKGQYEASESLGMSYSIMNYFVILPQAIRVSLANITGITISFIKDTSLVIVVGWFDLLGIVKPLSSDVNWLGTEPEGYLFVALLFWILCVTTSRLGLFMESRLNKHTMAKH